MTIQSENRRESLRAILAGPISETFHTILWCILRRGKATALDLEDDIKGVRYNDIRVRLHELASYEFCRKHFKTEPKLIAVGKRSETKGVKHREHTVYSANTAENQQGSFL